MIVDKGSKMIICTAFGKGRKHDFKLFKQSKTYMRSAVKCEADTGYQGIAELNANSAPQKRGAGKNH